MIKYDCIDMRDGCAGGSSQRGPRAKAVASQHESETLAQDFFTKMSAPGAVYTIHSTPLFASTVHMCLPVAVKHAQKNSADVQAIQGCV
jgi:hypothetical protein